MRESSGRVAVLVMVIACHLGLWMLLLRPVVFHRGTTPVVEDRPHVLKLRFLRPPRPLPHQASPRPPTAPAARGHATRSARSSKPVAVRQAVWIDAQPDESHVSSAGSQGISEDDSASDGGFQKRLRDARHAHSVHGVPGSDTPSALGIDLVDPMNRGIGAVMRAAQRAFGIKNSHCIDVDVWRHLTPQELSTRHVSPDDVDKLDEKYACNKPPGLHF